MRWKLDKYNLIRTAETFPSVVILSELYSFGRGTVINFRKFLINFLLVFVKESYKSTLNIGISATFVSFLIKLPLIFLTKFS